MALVNRSAPAFGGRRVNVPALGILAAGMVAAAALLPVAQTSNATSTGGEIRRLEAEKADIEARLYLQETELARLTSLDRVETRARHLGMVPADRWLYVTVAEPPPPATLPARYLAEQATAERPRDSRPLWKALLGRLPRP